MPYKWDCPLLKIFAEVIHKKKMDKFKAYQINNTF